MKKLLVILMLGMFLIGISGIAYATITNNRTIELPKELVDFSKTANSNFNYSIREYGKESMVCLYKITGTGKDVKQENIKCKRVENAQVEKTIKELTQKQLEKEKRIEDRKVKNDEKSKDLIIGSIELKAPSTGAVKQ
jgi:uncharacterized protein YxeA